MPQGSVLGPIVFIIYVKVLSCSIPNCEIIQYADDTQFVHTGSVDNSDNLINSSEEPLKLAKTYFHINGLTLDAKKTQCMFIGTRGLLSKIALDIHIKMDGNEIAPAYL